MIAKECGVSPYVIYKSESIYKMDEGKNLLKLSGWKCDIYQDSG